MADLIKRLNDLGLMLPVVPGPFGTYLPAKKVGNLVFVAGQLPMKDGKLMSAGQVPSRASVADAQAAAKQCVINGLAAALTSGITMDDILGVIRVGCFVSSDLSFTQQPQVANAASELLNDLFGDAGKHARAAVGVNTLPLDATVEIEFIFEVRS